MPYSSWAILYRTNAQSLGFETEFLHKKIPYTVVGTLKFYDREEIKDTVAWLSFIQNPKDEVSWRRIINKPVRGIGEKSQDKIMQESLGRSIADRLSKTALSRKAREGADSFLEIFENLSSLLPSVPVSGEGKELADAVMQEEKTVSVKKTSDSRTLGDFVEAVIEKSGLEEYHRNQDEAGDTQKLLNLQELVNSASLYPYSKEGLVDFLDHINLDRTLETEEDSSSTDRVVLITLHNTKGLEFDNVIITGMEHGIFPREGKDGDELEEERRLFYVGITRAKNDLYLTSCAFRRLYGRTDAMRPSPFLSEADSSFLRILGEKPYGFSAGNGSAAVADEVAQKYAKGKSVYHDDYGNGVIVRAEYSGEDEEKEWVITVSFENSGIKKFMPKYQSNSLTVISD